MSSQTDANETATEESAGDPSRWSLAPFLSLVCRSAGFREDAVRIPVRRDITLGRGALGAPSKIAAGERDIRWEIDDRQASREHARVYLDGRTWRLVDLESKNGTFVNGERTRAVSLRDGDWIRIGSVFFLFRIHRASEEASRRLIRVPLSGESRAFATLSPPLAEQFAQVRNLAPTVLPILISGETGAGKELIARGIHEASGRRGKFVAVNCGAIPETLIESELFGHKRGAFSGATEDRLGLIRAADGGTLFLDEVGELSEGSQVALLRVLQEREVRPVGATSAIRVAVRIVCATHQDLAAAVAAGRFRDDLYARLAGHVFELPPLRERREDLGIVMSALCVRHRGADGIDQTFSNGAMARLLGKSFRHNIRELEHLLTRALALAGAGERIRVQHLPQPQVAELASEVESIEGAALADRLRAVLEENRGNIAATSRAFGKAPMQIRRWCSRFKIDYRAFR